MNTRTEQAASVQKRYFDALKLIHGTLKYTDSLNLSAIIKDYNLSKSMYTPLKDGGILKTNGMIGRSCRYQWTGKEPNLEMAIELYNRLNNVDKRPNDRKGKPTIMRTKLIKTTRKSYLWGLYVVETTN